MSWFAARLNAGETLGQTLTYGGESWSTGLRIGGAM
jgi:hypothetical protein